MLAHPQSLNTKETTMRIKVQTLLIIAMAIAPAVAQVVKYGI